MLFHKLIGLFIVYTLLVYLYTLSKKTKLKKKCLNFLQTKMILAIVKKTIWSGSATCNNVQQEHRKRRATVCSYNL